ncbi:hypothetical protein [Yunchengibacter salinarum]|uniref:hypothetical protein n=1 Tax=Yunchengibacter salinarum TaxID=3133399 RepID=UPI0035B660CE
MALFSSAKSVAIATLLGGTALAGGVMLYGALKEPAPLPVLNTDLPPVVGENLLPPPPTYLMQEEPPSLPGVRKLKVIRPTLSNDPVSGDPAVPGQTEAKPSADFYLTGTRSADLIREPVEARLETFPTVDLDQAVEGALSVDEWGFQVVQAYFNQALGDSDAVKQRVEALLAGIEAKAGEFDLTTISDAVNLVVEAGARTYWSAYMAPFVLDQNFKLTGGYGWDLGPSTSEPYEDFVRVGANSKMLVGENMQELTDGSGSTITSDGIRNMAEFVVNNMENGQYRIIIVTAPKPDGEEVLYPFGVDVKRNGANMNLVDTRATDDLVPVMRLASEGLGRLGADGAKIDPDEKMETGHILATRAEVTDGTLRINFRQLGGQDTYVTAVMAYPEPANVIDQELALTVADFLQRVAPAAGADLTPEQILDVQLPVVDPVQVFADNAGGLPTNEGIAATPRPGPGVIDTGSPDPGADTPTGGGGNPADPDAGEPDGGGDTGGGDTGGGDTGGGDTGGGDTGGGDTGGGDTGGGDTGGGDTGGGDTGGGDTGGGDTGGGDTGGGDTGGGDTGGGDTGGGDTGGGDTGGGDTGGGDTGGGDTGGGDTGGGDTGGGDTGGGDTGGGDTGGGDTGGGDTGGGDTGGGDTGGGDTGGGDTGGGDTGGGDTGGGDTGGGDTGGGDTGGGDTPELVADAGVYDPIPLGEDFTLDGCGSTFADEAICSLTDTTEFELEWLLDGVSLGTGETLLVQTGEGTLFPTTGDFEVTLQVRFDGSIISGDNLVNLAGGGTLLLPGDLRLTSVPSTATIRIVAASVPEPAGLLVMLPGLAWLAYRRRRTARRRTARRA